MQIKFLIVFKKSMTIELLELKLALSDLELL